MENSSLRIGLTMRLLETEGYHEPRNALAQDWSDFLGSAFAEAAWLPIPNLGEQKVRYYCEKWRINRLILTGGDDIGVSVIRDETEKDLLTWASENAIPVLGICRGMQMIALCSGVTSKPVEGHVNSRHLLQGDIMHEVNSFHNYSLVKCPPGFKVTARSEDGEIEAIRHIKSPCEAWMWHPERESPFQVADIDRLERLFA